MIFSASFIDGSNWTTFTFDCLFIFAFTQIPAGAVVHMLALFEQYGRPENIAKVIPFAEFFSLVRKAQSQKIHQAQAQFPTQHVFDCGVDIAVAGDEVERSVANGNKAAVYAIVALCMIDYLPGARSETRGFIKHVGVFHL